jgi:hypothetical protein
MLCPLPLFSTLALSSNDIVASEHKLAVAQFTMEALGLSHFHAEAIKHAVY